MPVVKKRNQQTETRLLLESGEPVELPPAEIADNAVLAQFDHIKPFVPELLAALRAGTVAEPVPVMLDGATFAIHGSTRTFWVKIWHTNGSEMTRIERAQILSCIPSTKGVQVIVDGLDDEDFDDEDDLDEQEFDNDDDFDEPDSVLRSTHDGDADKE
ncbi:MAG TPA: hypothetical protein VGN86_13715 [Pyrinomonadaceae bacterium]|jgi:hypothetical protein|nr:hypothetical protein [Pyrinomonadaceae bacterium]